MVHKKFSRVQVVRAATISLAVILVLSFYLWHVTENIHLGYSINRAETAISLLREDVGKLEARKASLLALDRVEAMARTRLGLAEPREDQIVYEGPR